VFYRDVFGFGFKGYWDASNRKAVQEWPGPGIPDYAELTVGDSRVGLRPGEASGCAAVEFALTVPDLDAQCALIRKNGGEVTDPARQPWGARMATATDLHGYRWQLIEPMPIPPSA
jgi:uncharacterized glyoxalase superfamily protein PhnB